ncbi:transmembrane protein 18-like [Homarus americanus]|uniref:Transmembrane protein 18-like n=1 Tax=Homarus americanus TaxID=6706 RepID=A0A8J5JWE7_HOMAM|nr:transmembrane protein 18-like [Homarus americanus]KAG7162539.1 Transmembrane protein 18-like [Homarus americanus]
MDESSLGPEFIRTDQVTDLWSFLQTIDWSEGWLVGLVVFHIFLTIFTVMTRNHHTTQAVLFFLLLLTVRSSETINQYAAKNWQSFSRQQYFDSQGLFISVVFSMPVLFNCMMMVINWLWLSSSMMVTWKRAELEAKLRSDTLRQSESRRSNSPSQGSPVNEQATESKKSK